MIAGLIRPRPGPGVCGACGNFTREPAGPCRACRASESHLDVIVPISYALAGGPLHHALADYKRAAEPAVPDLIGDLAALLSVFLAHHERCVAEAAGTDEFDAVVVVPSSHPRQDANHPLRRIVARLVPETVPRYLPALRASGADCVAHTFNPQRFSVSAAVAGSRILLIDDVWTTGATAQSAAACLRAAGASSVAVVVIGRYLNGYWGEINERLAAIETGFDPEQCVICASDELENPALNRTGTRSVGPRLMDS